MANISVGRKTGFIRRNGVMRRETKWIAITETNTALAAANTAALFNGLEADELGQRPFTIVRTCLVHFVKSDQRAVSEQYQVGIGIAVVSDQALAIGITAVPTPFTDLGSDLFFLWNAIAGQISVTTDVGVLQEGLLQNVDSKAMRKVEDGQDIAITIENSGLSNGSNTVKFGRMLIKLH